MAVIDPLQIKDFLVEKVVKNYSGFFDKGTSEILAQIKREKIPRPVIYIGMGTCGLIAGADKTFKAVENYLEDNKTDAEVVKVGCLGLCTAEPLMDVQLPGKSRISFKHATEDKVEDLLNAVFHHTPIFENALGQYRLPIHIEWPGLGYIE
ncbi:MAG: (2Fe-2S) ferredoxin domain-containing protein, partial [Bacteroidota bacterium]